MAKDNTGDMLNGMKAICKYLGGISEATVLKYHRELDLPMRKSGKDGSSGVWVSSKKKLDKWNEEFVSETPKRREVK